MPLHEYVKYFPFPKIRDEQRRAIEFALDSYESGKKIVLLEMGTGTGKSATAIAIARYMEAHAPPIKDEDTGLQFSGAYILTTQKLLQNQYFNDFGPPSGKNLLRTIKSSTNYKCKFYEDQTCAESKRMLSKLGKALNGTEFQKQCKSSCTYSLEKQDFIESPISITNFSYFLAETTYAGKLEPRALLVVDECLRDDAKILIDIGLECSIGEIYKNHNITHVMSYNQENDSYERKRIVRRVRMPYEKDTVWYEITASSSNFETKITVTDNHKVWTKNRGYIRADKLTIADIVKFDTLEKQNITRNFIAPRAGKRSVESRRSKEKISCLTCGNSFLKSGITSHKNSILEIRTCLNHACNKAIEITKSSIGKKYCSHFCYSSADETSNSRSVRMSALNPMFNSNTVDRMRNSWHANWNNVRTEASKLEQINRFKDAPLHQNRKVPNTLEQSVIDLDIPSLVFTGLGEKWVTFKNGKHKNPDFIIEGTNKVVEVGDVYFWHTEQEIEETIKLYSEIGYECLYLTNKEIEESSEKSFLKLQKFVCNHDVKISNIRKIEKPKSWSERTDHYKYNIEVEDNHNYFANSILVSNCHNTEAELGKFIEVTFSEKFARDILKCKIPKLDSQEAVYEWVKTSYRKSVNKYVRELEKNLTKLSDATTGYGEFSKQYEMLEKHSGKVDQFLEVYSATNWVMNIAYPQIGNRRGARKFEFKPIDLSLYSQKTLFRSGKRLLMMSATVVDKDVFCSSLGLNPAEVDYLRIPSPFPIENRPIHYIRAGSMSKNNIDKTLPVMAEAVKLLLEKHQNEKGIIHTTSFKVAKYLIENIRSNRILSHDSSNRDEILKKHISCKEPTVIISPSMMEGVDLADDSSRFQILCKIPFPFLGDLVVSKRMERNRQWYPYTTAKSIIQCFGRSVRNENDHAISYILDTDWERFYSRNSHMLPEEFRASLRS